MADAERLITSDLNGGTYAVRTLPDGEIKVFVVVTRKPVNARGFYQSDTVYRSIKPGSRNFKHAVAKANSADAA
jgi:hypothetical protein